MATDDLTVLPLNPVLLNRISGVLTGWPENGPFYLIVSKQGDQETFFPDDKNPTCFLVGEEAARDTALAELRGRGHAAQALGPFVTDFTEEDKTGFGVKVTVMVTKNGKTETYDLSALGADMICWTTAAFNKFVSPFYAELHGGGAKAFRYVTDLKREMLTSSSGVLAHFWPTSPGTLEGYNALGTSASRSTKG